MCHYAVTFGCSFLFSCLFRSIFCFICISELCLSIISSSTILMFDSELNCQTFKNTYNICKKFLFFLFSFCYVLRPTFNSWKFKFDWISSLIEWLKIVTQKNLWMFLSSVVTLCMISRAVHRSSMSMLWVLFL